jgi:hypothetical protein
MIPRWCGYMGFRSANYGECVKIVLLGFRADLMLYGNVFSAKQVLLLSDDEATRDCVLHLQAS